MPEQLVPMVMEETARGERSFDIWSRLLKDRIVSLGTPIDDAVANMVTAQLLHLEAEDPERDISMYINSPGGSATALLGIYDTMRYVRPDVSTICVGQAASAGAILLACGAAGKRFALPNGRILLHQAHGEVGGQTPDIDIHAREFLRQRALVNEILARHTGQPVEKLAKDTDRDFILTPEEAKAYGVIDELLAGRGRRLAPFTTPATPSTIGSNGSG